MRKIRVGRSAQSENDRVAAGNRRAFEEKGVFVMNMIGSPGCGKTSILQHTAEEFGGRLAAIVGDVKTALDAERIMQHDVAAVPIETGGSCHLNARMIERSLAKLDLDALDFLFIENVGNLVCPSMFDLGEHLKIGVLSVPEGDEKVRKYPALFLRTDVVFINKIDLLPYCAYDVERVKEDLGHARADVRIFETSATKGTGFEGWFKFLRESARKR
jgi:hydrogenase nickel incorporation protein HypB